MTHVLDFLAIQEIGFDIISLSSWEFLLNAVGLLVLLALVCIVIVRVVRRSRSATRS